MSRILWKRHITPDANIPATTLEDATYRSQIENVRKHPWQNQEIPIPDAKAFRSMSRASAFLSHVCMETPTVLDTYLSRSRHLVGIYCAVENGPIDVTSTAKIHAGEEAMGFAEAYRKFRNPKMYLKQLPNLAPAQMGISFDIRGPMNVYTHSRYGSLQALEQAEWDLETGVVEAALVCTAHAFDDFLVVRRSRSHDIRTLVEGAGALVLVRDGARTDWNALLAKHMQAHTTSRAAEEYFGISDPIIKLLLKEGKNA